ncbi:MAG: DUF1566 domain-containing protein [Candidatus Omnitrophica bacterium]|nr:DUF1566 domain-containing protein [Candidatus Omnitrophota bacterium]
MKKIIQGLLLLFFFTSNVPSFAEEVEIRAIVPKPAGDLPKTGQTIQYDSKPDDGWYQMGNPVTPRFTAGTGAEAGTVTDNATGLMWEQKTDDGTIHDYNDTATTPPPATKSTYTWANAFDVFLNGSLNNPTGNTVLGLNTIKFANHDDWRIPNAKELESIVRHSGSAPYIDSIFTTSPYYTQSNAYWSSTTRIALDTFAYYVYFYSGTAYVDLKTSAYCVRAVRGGKGGLH